MEPAEQELKRKITEAEQELKGLINELFAEDLRKKVDQAGKELATQFQCAVNDFINGHEGLVNNAVTSIIKPIVEQLDKKIDKLNGDFEKEHGKLIAELGQLEKKVDESTTMNYENATSVHDDIRQSKTAITQQMTKLKFGSRKIYTLTKDKIIEEANKVRIENKVQGDRLRKDITKNIESLEEITDKLTRYNFFLMGMTAVEGIIIIYLIFK